MVHVGLIDGKSALDKFGVLGYGRTGSLCSSLIGTLYVGVPVGGPDLGKLNHPARTRPPFESLTMLIPADCFCASTCVGSEAMLA